MRIKFLIGLILIMITLAVFWQVGSHEFVNFDDDVYITENPHVTPGLTIDGVIWSFRLPDRDYWHPLTWLSHMLDCELYGLRPGMHHLTNLILHLANSLLLFIVLSRMTGAIWKSAFVAALFAIHPINVESVAWLAERKNVLSTFFWILTMLAYAYYSERPGIYRYLLVFFIFAMGLMTKPMLVTLPFVLLLLDYWPLGRLGVWQVQESSYEESNNSFRFPFKSTSSLRLVLEKVPLLTLSALLILIFSMSLNRLGNVISTEVIPMELRIENALVSSLGYIATMVWPQNLSVFYPYPRTVPIWQAGGAAFFLVCVSVFVFWRHRKTPYLVTGWLWYLGTLVPVLGIKQAGLWPAAADRWAYVPLIGVFIIIAWGVPHLLSHWRHRRIALGATATALLSVLMLCSWLQVRHWQSSTTLFEHALAATSQNYLAHNNLGEVLAAQGKLDEAMAHFSEALEINPDYAIAYNNLGNIFVQKGRPDDAIAQFVLALESDPDSPETHSNLGVVLFTQGKLQQALSHYFEALRLKPDYAEAHCNVGVALLSLGRVEEATNHYITAVQIKPDYAEAHNNLGNVLAQQGRPDEAIGHFSRALQIRSDYPEAHNNLGVALARQGRLQEAIDHFRKALRFKPDYVQARANLDIALQGAGKPGAK